MSTRAINLPTLAFLILVLLASSCARPPPSQRKFVSPVIDATILEVKSRMKDPVLAAMFENCLPNTLDTTVRPQPQCCVMALHCVHVFMRRFSRSHRIPPGSLTASSSRATSAQCGSGTAPTRYHPTFHLSNMMRSSTRWCKLHPLHFTH